MVPVVRRKKISPYLSVSGQIKNEFLRCLLAEFFGTMLFEIFGGSAPAHDTTAPAANGFCLVALSKCTAGLPAAPTYRKHVMAT